MALSQVSKLGKKELCMLTILILLLLCPVPSARHRAPIHAWMGHILAQLGLCRDSPRGARNAGRRHWGQHQVGQLARGSISRDRTVPGPAGASLNGQNRPGQCQGLSLGMAPGSAARPVLLSTGALPKSLPSWTCLGRQPAPRFIEARACMWANNRHGWWW